MTALPLAAAIGVAAGLAATGAQASTIVVSSLTDTGAGCDLREAIQSANADNAAGNGCANGSGPDTIHVPTGTIILSTGSGTEPSVSSDITIVGQGAASTTVTQGLAGRIFQVLSTGDLTLRSLQVSGGVLAARGAGILNNGHLSLDGVTVADNEAIAMDGGGIYGGNNSSTTIANSVIGAPGHPNIGDTSGGAISIDSGALLVSNSVFADNKANGTSGSDGVGGAIRVVDAALPIRTHRIFHSVFSGNSGARGAGVFGSMNMGQALVIDGTTFSGNDSAFLGGGAFFYGPVSILNSTFSGNTAAFGAAISTDQSPSPATPTTVALTNSTLAGNQAPSGAGISSISGSTVTLRSSVLKDSGGECDTSGGGTISTGGYNVVSDSSCTFTGAGDLQSTDPLLGPLADNGGAAAGVPPAATIRTRALLADSPAIDHAPCSGLTIDERAFPRPSPGGGLCDSGAYELTQPEPSVPTIPTFPAVAPVPSNEFSFGKLKRKEKKGIAFLVVNLPGPGDLGLTGKGLRSIGGTGVARASLAVSGGTVKLKIQPAKKGKRARKIRRALLHRGKAKVKVSVTYLPAGGTANTQARKLKLLRRR